MIKPVKSMFDKIMGKPSQQFRASTSDKKSGSYPLQVLIDNIGKNFEVHYLDLDQPHVEESALGSRPTDNFFYLSHEGVERHIVYWNTQHSDGRVSGVKLIKKDGAVVYVNESMPFDYQSAVRYEKGSFKHGPTRKMTQEYLEGVFG